MEDENCLELSLAPPSTGGGATSATDARSDIHDRDTKLINEFKHFLDGGGGIGTGTIQIGLRPGIASQMKPENMNIGSFWITNDTDAVGNEEFRGRKRKNAFAAETSQQKKHDKSRAASSSHISISTSDDDDSTAENEDVADSDATTSRPFLTDFQFPNQPMNIMNTAHLNPSFKNIRPMWSQQDLPSNLSDMLPALDKSNSMKFVSQNHQQINQSYVNKHNDGLKMTQGILPDSSEFTQHDIKAVEGVSTTHMEDVLKGISNRPSRTYQVFPSEYQTIKPGIASDLKFGGGGSYPNLPWVSTTGSSGPNSRTISGVTYRYNPTQIRIVCACHGTHFTPEDFVHHANEDDNGVSVAVVPFATSVPAESARS